ncbi:MAG: leucyl/phenylalanyl-tRNA--protein transferase [Deltaproteobacteria bacterium]|nr:leucyl/phenylalanyl-tRNA--protein transferase [Deltaproteobacteria bacterium]
MPPVTSAPRHGCLAAGGDLEPGTILAAYRQGIFPWPDRDGRLLWWSPDPRAILPLDGFHGSRSLARARRRGRHRVTLDQDCAGVIAGCADRVEGTWITPAMRRAYERLHALGWVHSVEVWDGAGALVGGVYGVAIGRFFAAESKFHRAPNASKIALAELVEWLAGEGFELLDVQLTTDHLRSLGAVEITRAEYLRRLAAALADP